MKELLSPVKKLELLNLVAKLQHIYITTLASCSYLSQGAAQLNCKLCIHVTRAFANVITIKNCR